MPHTRNRHILPLVEASIKWSPVVGLFGLRQVGKSTLVHQLVSPQHAIYETFDNQQTLESSKLKTLAFLKRPKLLCVDEAQKAPWIFPVIKEIVGIQRKPSQFLLTGSIRFTLKKEIRESLTGRILFHELLPFTISESHSQKQSGFLKSILLASQNKNAFEDPHLHKKLTQTRFSEKTLDSFCHIGGMPIPCFSRNTSHRNAWYHNFFETLILRDLVLVDKTLTTISLQQGLAFLRTLSEMQADDLNIQRLATQSMLSQSKAKKMILALEALSLIDLIAPLGLGKKSNRKFMVQWKDIGLWNYFYNPNDWNDSKCQNLLISQELRSQISMLDQKIFLHHHKTRDSSLLPWVISNGAQKIAILSRPEEAPTSKSLRFLNLWLKQSSQNFGIVLLSASGQYTSLGKNLLFLPMNRIF